MPPWTPPERLVAVRTPPAFGTKASLCSEPFSERAGKAAADLEALGRGKRKHRLGQVGLEAVEDRLAEARRDAADAAVDDAADRVALGADLLDPFDHGRGGGRIRAADGLASTSASVGNWSSARGEARCPGPGVTKARISTRRPGPGSSSRWRRRRPGRWFRGRSCGRRRGGRGCRTWPGR